MEAVEAHEDKALSPGSNAIEPTSPSRVASPAASHSPGSLASSASLDITIAIMAPSKDSFPTAPSAPRSMLSSSTWGNSSKAPVRRERKAKLPSVLDPKTVTLPELKYPQALDFLNQSNAFYGADVPLGNRTIDVTFFGLSGFVLFPLKELTLSCNPPTSLQTLVLDLQRLLDLKVAETKIREKLLVASIEIRIFGNANFDGFPKLKGALGMRKGEWKGDEEKAAEYVVWDCDGGDMEQYWDAFCRSMLLATSTKTGNSQEALQKAINPMLKVRSVMKLGELGALTEMLLLGGGHAFTGTRYETLRLETPKKKLGMSSTEEDSPLPMSASQELLDNMIQSIKNKHDENGNPLQVGNTEIEFTLHIMKDMRIDESAAKKLMEEEEERHKPKNTAAFKIYEKMLRKGRPPMKELVKPRGGYDKSRPVDPNKNWGIYQRMGGDPRMHKAFSLDHIPFDVGDCKVWVGPEDPDYPGATGKQEAGTSSNEEHAPTKMVPYIEFNPAMIPADEESAKLDRHKAQQDAAKGFDSEDDDAFLLPIGTKLSLPSKGRTFYDDNSNRIHPKQGRGNKANLLHPLAANNILAGASTSNRNSQQSHYLASLGRAGNTSARTLNDNMESMISQGYSSDIFTSPNMSQARGFYDMARNVGSNNADIQINFASSNTNQGSGYSSNPRSSRFGSVFGGMGTAANQYSGHFCTDTTTDTGGSQQTAMQSTSSNQGAFQYGAMFSALNNQGTSRPETLNMANNQMTTSYNVGSGNAGFGLSCGITGNSYGTSGPMSRRNYLQSSTNSELRADSPAFQSSQLNQPTAMNYMQTRGDEMHLGAEVMDGSDAGQVGGVKDRNSNPISTSKLDNLNNI